MKKLLVYLNDYKKECVLGPLFKLLEVVFELLVPLVVAAVIDRGIGHADTAYILRMFLLLVGLGLVGLVSAVTAQYYAARAAAGFATKLRRALFAHIQSLAFSELDRLGTASLITRMTSDVNQLQTGVNLALRLLLRSPFVVFGAMLMAFIIDARAALIFAVAIPLLAGFILGVMLLCLPLYKRVQTRLDGVLGHTRENLSGVRVIRAFRREEAELREFTRRNELLTRTQKRAGHISALLNPVTFLLINLAVAVLVWTGALRVEAGLITQGAVVALYNYMSQILVELIKLANLIITLSRAAACGNRIQAVFALVPAPDALEKAPPEDPDAPMVEFRGVSLRYQGAGETALTGLDFSVRCGEIIGVIGGTGAGKSSLVGLIPRFYDTTVGEVLVCGVNVRDYPLETLRRKIGFVPQKAVLFRGSLRENLQWGKRGASDAEIYAALETAQARDVAEGKGGLAFKIEQGGRNLSGGQRQRFTIARALVRRPDILILDDSSSALDQATDARLRRALRRLENRPTVFIVSQRASVVQQADRILVLDDGALVGLGTAEELMRSCAVYREIVESQFRKEDAIL